MKNIGGFFELELSNYTNLEDNAIALWCGRASFRLLLECIKPSKVYMPFYTCDSLLKPLEKLNIDYEFYEINDNFYPNNLPILLENEYFLYINYFGIYKRNVDNLVKNYGKKLILDNTQAFFSENHPNIWSFNSLRKFFGVSDGSLLNVPVHYHIKESFDVFNNFSADHLINRLVGNQKISYQQYQENENRFSCEILKISVFSKKIFNSINLSNVKRKRRENFKYLHSYLRAYNKIKNIDENGTAFCYPFLSNVNENRIDLVNKNIFIPNLWKDVLERKNNGFEFEKYISKQILPLPIDQRYSVEDMNFILKNIINL